MLSKNSLFTPTRLTSALALAIFATGAMAANFDLLNQPQGNFGITESNAPAPLQTWENPSILDSLQREKANEKKRMHQDILILLQKNKLAEADARLAELLKQYPKDPDLYNLKALSETLHKNIAAAEKNYQKTITLDKNNILAYLGLAKLKLDDDKFEEAKNYANKALAIDNKAINGYLLLADAAYKQKNPSEVENILTTALTKVKGNIQAEIEIIKNFGKFYAAQKQPEKLLALTEDLAKRYPDDGRAWSALAGAQIVNKKNQEAEKTLTQIIDKNKNDIEHRLLLVRLYNENPAKAKEALKLLDETIAIAPNNPQAYVFKTAYLIKAKDYQAALDLAEQVEKKFPEASAGLLLKGDVFLSQKKLDVALDNYRQAYKKQPNDRVLYMIADILNVQNKSAEAVKLLDQELAKNPKNSALQFKLAGIYQQQKNYRQAEAHYKTMLKEQPDSVLALNNLAWIYSQEKNPQAIELAGKAYQKAPESAAIADTYGYILIKQGQPKQGLEILEKAARLAPDSKDIQFHLAEAYADNGQAEKAQELLKKLLEDEKNFAEKQSAAELLQKLSKK